MRTTYTFSFSLAFRPFALLPTVETHIELAEDDELPAAPDAPDADTL